MEGKKRKERHLSIIFCDAPVQNEGHSVEFQDLSVQLAR